MALHTTHRLSRYRPNTTLLVVIGFVIAVGTLMVLISRAATPAVSLEADAGTVTAPAVKLADTAASGGSAVQFKAPAVSGGLVSTTPNLKVAFVGDTKLTTGTKNALALVKSEGASLLIHVGDFDYTNNPNNWEAQTTAVLGANFPQISVLGNHDENHTGYVNVIKSRLARTPDIKCEGSIGIKMDCMYKGLRVVGVTPGNSGPQDTGHDTYIRDRLAVSNATWNICGWHENMVAMQAGYVVDTTGWGVYEECRKGAGISIQGHEHSYSRTKTLTNMATQTVDPSCNSPTNVCVAKGRSFAVVNGLGGAGLDPQDRCRPTTYPYGCKGEWAKMYTSSQGSNYAMLFMTFNVDGNPNKAVGYLKDISGKTGDSFVVTRQ